MDFSFEKLKYYYDTGEQIGTWKGTPVKAISKNDLKKSFVKRAKNWWVVFDDGNKLVKENMVYGWIKRDGSVEEANGIFEVRVVVPETKKEMDSFESCFDTSWVNEIFFDTEAKG
jgi:hypothetical protein